MRTRLLALFIVTITLTLTFLNVGVSPVRASGLPTDGNVIWTGISNPSVGDESALGVAVDAIGVYVVGYDNSLGGSNNEWRIEKRSLTGGGVIWSQIENPSTGSDVAYGVAVDATGLYVVGYDYSPGNYEWRMEKRTLSTGAIIWTKTSNPSTGSDAAYGVAVDATGVYVVGYDNIPGGTDYEWRIEKRNIATGASIWNATDNPGSTGWTGGVDDSAWGAAVDSSGLYLTGWDYNLGALGGYEWRIEKRDLSTGSLIGTFGTSGVIQEDNGAMNDRAQGVAVDGSGLYLAGYDSSSGNYDWRIEKRNLSSGTTIWAKTSDPSSGHDDVAYGVAVDSSGVYVVGYVNSPADWKWGIEKRNLSDGSLIWAQVSNPSANADNAANVAVGAAGVYVVGGDRVPVNAEWRVEKRNPGLPLWVVSVQLYLGWNLVSLPVVPLSSAPKDLLGALIANGTITTVWSYSGSPAPSWKYFDAKKGTGTLTSIMDGMGLWIFMMAPGVLNVEGYVIPPAGFPSQYSLVAGWNLVGYKPQPDATVQETVSSYLPSLPMSSYDATSIWVYDSSIGQWSRGDTTTLHPGQAFWILMKTPAMLRP